ncbi:Gustatory receptor 82d [Halyomorpha halys]|nr:Gustatory receptor 82d [Halyomorpha halys]
MLNSHIVQESLLSVFHTSRWFGLFPFTINIDGYFQLSFQHCILPCILLLSNIIYYIIVALYFDVVIMRNSWIHYCTSATCLLFQSLYPIISITELFFRMKVLNEAIAKLKKVYDIVFPGRCLMKYKFLNTYILTSIASFAAMFIYDVWKFSFINNVKSVVMVAFLGTWHTFLVTVLVDRFSFVVGVVTSLFKLCNDDLSLLSTSISRTKRWRLERLCWAHDQLCDCATIISGAHSFQIYSILNIFILVIAGNMFTIMRKLIDGVLNLLVFVPYFCFFCVYCYIPWRIVGSFDNCKNEAKKFNTLLYQVMIQDSNNEISENKVLELHISMKREVVFSACGFLSLDYSLIHSMVAGATTFLVILIQFGQPLNTQVPAEHPYNNLTSSSGAPY